MRNESVPSIILNPVDEQHAQRDEEMVLSEMIIHSLW